MYHRGLTRALWLLLILLLLLPCLVGQPARPALAVGTAVRQDPGEEWAVQLVDKQVGPAAALALDRLGYPHVSYVRNDALVYAWYDGSAWQTRVVDPGPIGDFVALRLNAADQPRFAYYESYNTALKYAQYNGFVWTTEFVDNHGVAGWFVSLALDRQGNPHISYYSYTPGYAVKYAYLDSTALRPAQGDAWHIETVDAGVGTLGGHTFIAVDAAGVPSVAYHDSAHGVLKYARREGASWTVETVDNGEVGGFCSLALDSAGRPHISYRDQGQNRLLYAFYNDIDWTIEVVDPNGGSYGSLALDDRDRPAIAYYTAPGTALRYARRDQSWQTEPIPGAGSGAEETALLLGYYGEPHLLYHETTTENLYYVHRLVWLNRQYLPVVARGPTP